MDGFDNSSGILTWTDDLASISENTTTADGYYVTYNSEVMNHFPFNKITEATDEYGNVFASFPKMYMKWITDDSSVITGVRFSNEQVDDEYFIPDCFLDPRDETGASYVDSIWIGKYEGSGNYAKFYSVSNAEVTVNIAKISIRQGCRAYGTSSNAYNGYQSYDLAFHVLYSFLVHTLTKNANIQNVYSGRTNKSAGASATGTCDGVSGLNGWNTNTTCVKFLGVENPYGNISTILDGVSVSSNSVCIQRFPASYYSANYTSLQVNNYWSIAKTTGYVSALKHGDADTTKSYVWPSANNASTTGNTHYGDRNYYNTQAGTVYVGGYYYNNTMAGLWNIYAYYSSQTYSDKYTGGRLCRRPID